MTHRVALQQIRIYARFEHTAAAVSVLHYELSGTWFSALSLALIALMTHRIVHRQLLIFALFERIAALVVVLHPFEWRLF